MADLRRKSLGATVSLPGALLGAAGACRRTDDSKHFAGVLEKLLADLREVRAKPESLAAFLEHWTDSGIEI